MKAPIITLVTAAMLCVVFAVSALASSAPVDITGTVASVSAPIAASAVLLEDPATTAVRGVGNLPSTSTDSSVMLMALGAILMTFGIAILALRFSTPRR
jgi:LPXTG-motif cell wall-anchored protein